MRTRQHVVPIRRWWTVATTLVTVTALSACAVEQAVAPDAPVGLVEMAAAKSTSTSALDAFVAAQGTWCDRGALYNDCAGIDTYGLGYILYWCEDFFCAGPLAMVVDFAGVNPRWWAGRGLPSQPAFSATGSVNETITREGRRRLVINVKARNTFVAMLDVTDGSFPFGADFLEYPGVLVGNPGRQPELGEATLSADIILPAGYVGMPDLVQVIYDPAVFFDIGRLVMTSTGTGTLRRAVNGIPAGTKVTVNGDFHLLAGSKFVDQRQKFYRNARSVGLGGAARVTVRRAP